MEVSRVQTLILLLIALGLPGRLVYGQQHQDDARKISVAVVRSKSATIKHSYKCRINSLHYFQVLSPVEGRLAATFVKEGQVVKRGDLLFQVEPTGRKEKPEAGDQDKLVSIEAPFDNLLVGPLVSLRGNRVRKDESLGTLSDDSATRVYFDVPDSRLLAYMTKPGEATQIPDLELIVADGSKYPLTGKIVGIEAKFASETGDSTFVVEFPNPDRVLRRGQTGTLLLKRVLKDAIVIPQRTTFDGFNLRVRTGEERVVESRKMEDKTGEERVVESRKMEDRFPPDTPAVAYLKGIAARFEVQVNRYVYVVDKDHVAHRREIVIKEDADDIFVIEKGLEAGERIVVDGVSQVRDGDKVE